MIFTFKLSGTAEYMRVDYAKKQMITVLNYEGLKGIRISTDFNHIKTIVHTLLSDSDQYAIISEAEFFDVHNDVVMLIGQQQEELYAEQFLN
jgi:hypothetical protein